MRLACKTQWVSGTLLAWPRTRMRRHSRGDVQWRSSMVEFACTRPSLCQSTSSSPGICRRQRT
eukprot:6021334-Lingulodinium_polyedra.AAC.1